VVDTCSLSASLSSVTGDLKVRFASCTRDTAFVFQPRDKASSTSSGYDGAVAASPSLEYNVSFSYFLSRLRQQIIDCDHIVPVERADEAAQLTFLLLEEQQRRLLGAISSRFPYQRDSVYWAQGNRVCEVWAFIVLSSNAFENLTLLGVKVSVQETQQDQQWGLLVQANVRSQLRPRVGVEPPDPQRKRAPSLSSCTCCKAFLPKGTYLRLPAGRDAFQASIAVELGLNDTDDQELGADHNNDHKGDGEGESDSEPSSEKVGEQALSFTAELPELLTVSVWGSHDEDPFLDGKGSSQATQEQKRTNAFRKVHIETVRWSTLHHGQIRRRY
jgi:hypothetical protein